MNVRHAVLYPIAGAVLLGTVAGLGVGAEGARAQASPAADAARPAPTWTLVLDGTPADWPGAVPTASLDSVRAVGRRVLRRLRRRGYYYARLDSATIDTTRVPPTVRLHARRGPQVTVADLRIEGAQAVPRSDLRRLMRTDEGEPLRPRRLEADVQAILTRYERAGHPLAEVRVRRATIDSTDRSRLRLTLRVTEGPALWLKRIVPDEGSRTRPALLAHLAALRVGAPLTDYDPEALRRRLEQSELFRAVEAPELTVGPEGGAILRVPVEEAPPGTFDLVLGYLPASTPRGSGQIVGSGHLSLRNLFGGGRRADLTLDRRPGRSSVFDLVVADPYLFGLPLRLEGQFRGEQRDSTYSERTYGAEVGYRFEGGLEVMGSLQRGVARPGPAGRRLRDGRQLIPRSRSFFYGLGLRYEAVDRPVNPRRGVRFDAHVEQGSKSRLQRRVTDGDTTQVRRSLRQERLRLTARGFVPLIGRQVVAVGLDGRVLRSDVYDRSDLFRFGGAQSLRGYDEDRFLGNVTARALLEYRVQVGPRSYVYGFGDLGYLRRPALGASAARQSWRPGYGLGVQLDTDIGRITTTYALNPAVATPINGRVHLGLSVAL